MKWLKNIFVKKRRVPYSATDAPIKEVPITEEWIAVWHGVSGWDNGSHVSYTIFYCPQVHKFTIRTRGFRAEEHSFYHNAVLGNYYRFQRSLYKYSPVEMIAQIAEMDDLMYMEHRRVSPPELSIEEIERMIQENLDIENYREVARLQKELDKRRGL